MENNKYFIIGGKWFDKVNGNTYCNAKILDDNGNTIGYTGFEYGYGNYYFQSAKQYLQEHNLLDDNTQLVDLGGDTYIKYWDLKKDRF